LVYGRKIKSVGECCLIYYSLLYLDATSF